MGERQRGRLTSVSERTQYVAWIREANQSGARLPLACDEVGISLRTYKRWYQDGQVLADKRPDAVRPEPLNKLSKAEQEASRLRAVMQKEGIKQNEFGGRMHYLRWEHPSTLQAWNDAGMAYDTTLSYADRPGFRCGSCYEYPAFNPVSQQSLAIRIRPLIAMECTIIADRYMGLGYGAKAESKFTQLKDRCRQVNGCFTLLWHNSHFSNQADFKMYQKVIRN